VSFLTARWIGSDLVTLILSVAASIGAAALFWFLFERASLAFAHRVRLKSPKTASAEVAPAGQDRHSSPFDSETGQRFNHVPSGES